MIRHLFKMVWNRKRANLLVVVEIFISFLVVFVVASLAVYCLGNVSQPLGYTYQDVWNVSVDSQRHGDDTWTSAQVETYGQIFRALKQLDEVEGLAGAITVPFGFGQSTSNSELEGVKVEFERSEVTDDFATVLGLTITRGRFFGKEDDGVTYEPVVVNERFVSQYLKGKDPIGQSIGDVSKDDKRAQRIVGVVKEYRRASEFSASEPNVMYRTRLDDPKSRPPSNILLKVRAGTPRAFEEKLMKTLQDAAKEWSFIIQPLPEGRLEMNRFRLAPIVVVSLIAVFLLMMVALGLTGVLWQTVTQRTREIGLRRAKGANAGDIYRQILGEIWIITALGITVGTIVVLQLPILDVFSWVSHGVYATSWAVSTLVVFALTTVCGLYPASLATRVHPATALHYE